jgi:arylsulfatase
MLRSVDTRDQGQGNTLQADTVWLPGGTFRMGSTGTLRIWAEPFTKLRVPKMFDLRSDPFERADITSNSYYDWFMSNPAPFLASQSIVGPFLATFKDYPPSQRPSSFSIDQLVEKMLKNLEPAH